jgi:DnaJ like chaperone protein
LTYWGRIIGVIIGLLTRNPWLVLLGFLVGYQVDRGFAEQVRADWQARQGARRFPVPVVRVLFQSIGHLTKSDGRVSEDEIRAARSLMHRLGLGPTQVRQAIAWFDQGKEPGFPFREALRQLCDGDLRRAEQRAEFLKLMLEVSLSKGRVDKSERDLLWGASHELGIGRVEFAQLEAMVRAQRVFRDSPQGLRDQRQLEDAYRTLGLDAKATNSEIKKAYRRLMNRNHPDKLQGRDAAPDAIAEAGRKTRDIRRAYDMLKARRGIR